MSSTTLVPVEDYLRLTEKPNCEYRDGVLYPKAMATTFHGILEPMSGSLSASGASRPLWK